VLSETHVYELDFPKEYRSMKQLGYFASVLSLVFMAACGGGGGPANPGTPNANFSNATFKGNYVFTMEGQCVNACSTGYTITSAGVMVADGNGNITGGEWDLNVGGVENELTLTGTYGVNADGTATATLNAGGGAASYVMMLTGTNGGYIVSNDTTWALSGVMQKQSSVVQPSGNLVFRGAGQGPAGLSYAIAGAVNLGTGAVTADMNNNGSFISLGGGLATITNPFDANGRGVVTIASTGTLPGMSFVVYAVDANSAEIVSTDNFSMQGRAELSGGALTSGSILSGKFAFLSAGYPVEAVSATTDVGSTEGGIFTGDGAGSITGGTIDAVYDSTALPGSSLTASGTVSTAGGVTRDTIVTSTGSATLPMKTASIWFVNANRAFFVTTGSGRAEAGTMQSQSGGPFSDNATFGFYQTGWGITSSGPVGLTSTTLFANSGGTVGGYTQSLNLGFSGPNVTTGNGTLSFDTATGTLGSLTLNKTAIGGEDMRIYQYSSTQAFIMEVDPTVITSGTMTLQTPQ
jgi:hypothetical protein